MGLNLLKHPEKNLKRAQQWEERDCESELRKVSKNSQNLSLRHEERDRESVLQDNNACEAMWKMQTHKTRTNKRKWSKASKKY